MKTILQVSKIIMLVLMISTVAQAQYTCQTAVRFDGSGTGLIPTDSNLTVQPGIGTGCANLNSQPVWVIFGFCESGNVTLNFEAYPLGGFSNDDTLTVVLYGPFLDTLNLFSKLTNSNIDTCHIQIGNFNNSWNLNSFQYQRGDIYIALMTSNSHLAYVRMSNSSLPFMQVDKFFCPFCNGRLSELYQPVCTVSYDSSSQKNKIVWTKDIFTPAQDYVIYRKNANSSYDTVAYQSISQLSEFIDSTSSPLSKVHQYKLGIRDSCGQIMDKDHIGAYTTPTFTTTHLIAYPTGNNSAGLIWNAGTAGSPFFIYRTDPFGLTTLIDSIAIVGGNSQTYTDVNAPAGLNSYQIGVRVNPPCVPSLLPSYDMVKSNPGYVIVTGINELTDLSSAISIQPNPFNDFTKVDLHLLSKQNSKIVLRNVTGQIILQFEDVKTNELIISKNNLAQGLYFLEVTGDNFYARKKVVVQ